jgi:RNA polymerase sigma-70 factor (ECF subfamily)
MLRDLVEAAGNGDHDAFEMLIAARVDRLYAMAALILRDRDGAGDAVQETLVRVWRELPTLRDPESFDAWCRRILVNACSDLARSERRLSASVRILRLEPNVDDGTGIAADRDRLERAFRRLKPEYRALVVLHFYVGLTVPEVAQSLSIPLGTAKSRLHYATTTLRAALDADERNPESRERWRA